MNVVSFSKNIVIRNIPQILRVAPNTELFTQKSIPTVSYNKYGSCLASHFDALYRHVPESISKGIMEVYRSSLYKLANFQQIVLTTGSKNGLDRLPLELSSVSALLHTLPGTTLIYHELDAKGISDLIDSGHAVIVHHPMVFSRNQDGCAKPLFTPHHYAITAKVDNGKWKVKNPVPEDTKIISDQLICPMEKSRFSKSFITERDITTELGSGFVVKGAVNAFNRFIDPLGGREILPQYIAVKIY